MSLNINAPKRPGFNRISLLAASIVFASGVIGATFALLFNTANAAPPTDSQYFTFNTETQTIEDYDEVNGS